MRRCGILYPISSLPSRFGIGCFSKEAYEFVDFLHEAGQSCWQILPVGPTGFGDSPYQPVSAFAGNPYFISPEKLIEDGLLTWEECNGAYFGSDETRVDYGALYENRYPLLRTAFNRFRQREDLREEYEEFLGRENAWLEDYVLYMALKEKYSGASWQEWEEDDRRRKAEAMKKVQEEHAETCDFVRFQQFLFDRQWRALKAYANEKGIEIIGDIPFYTALDSADVWAHPEAFLMDKDLKPTFVAGCAPDAFSATGQLWGNPIYNWTKLAADNYAWWIERFRRNLDLYDVLRIDHFHGFAEYYAIPYGDENALNGTLKKGPGMKFFNSVKKQLGELSLIAEDLGTVTETNEKLLKDSGFPGMKVLQFAFTSWDSKYVTHRHEKNCVVYTGTHDNTTLRAWVEEINEGSRDFTRRYINSRNTDYGALVWDLIREAYRSVADLCIIPIQDYLVEGREARMNEPGTQGNNWQWRVRPNFLSADLARSIRELADLYGRAPIEKP